MQAPLTRRVLLVALLLITLFSLCVWYGTLGPNPELGNYPDSHEVSPAPEAYVGDPVVLSGYVVDTDPVVIEVPYGVDQTRQYVVRDVRTPVSVGTEFRVFGTLFDEDTVDARSAFTVSAGGNRYMFAVSFLAGLWVLTRLCLHWRLDVREGLTRRSSPVQFRSRLRSWANREGRDA